MEEIQERREKLGKGRGNSGARREARKRWRKFRSEERNTEKVEEIRERGEKHGKGGGSSGAKRSTEKVEEIQEQREARKRWRKFRS